MVVGSCLASGRGYGCVWWSPRWSAYPFAAISGKALRWQGCHQQQAAIRYIWSQTFPESGNLSPVRGRFGGWCLRGQNRISPTPAYRVVASPVIRVGPSTPAPGYGCAEAQWFAIYGPAQSKVVV